MEPEVIQSMIESGLPGAKVQVAGDGRHFQAVIVYDAFEGKLPLARHRMVYAVLEEHIASDALHALSMKTVTTTEWEAQQGQA